MRLGLILLFAALAIPAFAQRIDVEGGNATTVNIGPTDTEIDRAVEGNLTIDLDDGLSVEAGGSAELGIDGESRPVDGTLTLGETDDADTPEMAANPAPAAAAEDEAAAQSEVTTSPPTDAEDCSEPAAFAAQREAFLEQEPLEDFVYIRRIDISVCGYESSMPLIARLNSLPTVRAGLEHMQIDPDSIVSARWTDDRGLLVYTAEPEGEPEAQEEEAEAE